MRVTRTEGYDVADCMSATWSPRESDGDPPVMWRTACQPRRSAWRNLSRSRREGGPRKSYASTLAWPRVVGPAALHRLVSADVADSQLATSKAVQNALLMRENLWVRSRDLSIAKWLS